MSGNHQSVCGWQSPLKPKVKPSIPNPWKAEAQATLSYGAPGQPCQSLFFTKDEANVMLPYSGKKEPVLPAPTTLHPQAEA